MRRSSAFALSNVPYVNARLEIAFLLEQLANPEFTAALEAGTLDTPFWSWRGPAHELMTDLMRRSIVALESYVVGAARLTALNAGAWTETLEKKFLDPFKLGARGAADAHYNKVPSLLSLDYSLAVADPVLWREVAEFYRSTRNPLFHGSMIREADIAPLVAAHELLGRVYSWIDAWSTY